MSPSVDNFVHVLHLKDKVYLWRSLALVVIVVLILLIPGLDFTSFGSNINSGNIIARLYVTGVIDEDHERDKLIDQIKNDNRVKGVIVHIDSPGGTMVGSEGLYNSLRGLSAKKHVVAVMGNFAASGGYMVAIAADHIIAHNGTITGSIGVLLNSIEVVDLANKIGVNFRSLRAGEFKDSLSPFRKISEESEQQIQEVINDTYDYFLSLVAKRRSMNIEEVKERAEGKIYNGRQALLLSLIDQIGGEVEAINWLKGNNSDGKLKDFFVKDKRNFLFSKILNLFKKSSYGLMAIWDGATMTL